MRHCSTARRRALVASLLGLVAACADRAPIVDSGAALSAGTIAFVEPTTIDLGAAPNAIAVVDLDGDGKPDLAASAGTSGVVVSLAREGGFAAPRAYGAGDASALVAGDFDRDGKVDVAVLNEGGVGVLLGKGDGSFGAPRSFAAGQGPIAMVKGDFDRDGRLDLAVLQGDGGSVSVLLGNGDGTFQRAQPYAALPGATWLAAGDVDGDGKLDLLAVTHGGGAAPILGNGDGTFRTAPTGRIYAPDGISTIATGDFDGDGKLDVAFATRGMDDHGVVVTLGNGDGTFREAGSVWRWRLRPTSVAFGDLDGDGKLDLVAGVANGSVVLTALGKGGGALGEPVPHAAPAGVVWAADLDGDGKADVITPTEKGVTVLASRGDGSLRAARAVECDGRAHHLAVGDFNRDGVPDLAVTREIDGLWRGQMFLGDGHGGLRAAGGFWVGDISIDTEIAAIDVNGDGNLDLVVASGARVLLGNGDGSFRTNQRTMGPEPDAVLTADFDGDGKLDLITYTPVQPGRIGLPSPTFLRGNGDGTFAKGRPIPIDGAVEAIAAVDLDGDGKPDLVVCTPGGLVLLAGKGDGTFAPARILDESGPKVAVTAADVNGDGRIDLVVAHAGEEVSTVLLNMGDGTFRPAGRVPSSGRIRVADLDGDGVPDLVVQGGMLTVYRGRGDGTFERSRALCGRTSDVVLADLDGDGLPEVVAAEGWSQFLPVFRNVSR